MILKVKIRLSSRKGNIRIREGLEVVCLFTEQESFSELFIIEIFIT